MNFMSLPQVMIENVFSYLSFDEIAQCREVSSKCNDICGQMLTRGLKNIEKWQTATMKQVKRQLPRRESERRNHHLSKHVDILTSIETRISMLKMTYTKYIDLNMCCFIPGKIIDEMRRLLILVEVEQNPPRAHEVLQELRDICCMAIEHFDEKISPGFREKLKEGTISTCRPIFRAILGPILLSTAIKSVRVRTALNARRTSLIRDRLSDLQKLVIRNKRIIMAQQTVIKLLYKRQRQQDSTIDDLKKRVDECDIKYRELTHTNVGKTMSEPSSQSLRHFSSQIKLDLSVLPIGSQRTSMTFLPNMKPRRPLINLPSLSESEDEPPKKVPKYETKRNEHFQYLNFLETDTCKWDD